MISPYESLPPLLLPLLAVDDSFHREFARDEFLVVFGRHFGSFNGIRSGDYVK